MNNEPVAYINVEERKLEWAKPTLWETPTIAKIDKIPLYTHPAELTDEVRDALMDALSGWKYIRHSHGDLYGVGWDRVQDKLEAILRKASENEQ